MKKERKEIEISQVRKYEFIGEIKKIKVGEFEGRPEYIPICQIKAVRDFGDVKNGDIGGWITKESNLSHEGDCWVYPGAKAYQNAKIYENAKLSENAEALGQGEACGNAKLSGNAKLFNFGLISGNAEAFGEARIYSNIMVIKNDWKLKDINLNRKPRI